MTEAKRGRPAKPDSEKRQQIGVRTSPTLKTDLEQAAAENGRSVAQEAELRLERSFEAERQAGDAETSRLLNMIANEIAIIQSHTGKRWHRDLMTWAAVQEACAGGPIRRLRPDRPTDDEVVNEAWNRLWAIEQNKTRIIARLRDAGFYVEDYPRKVRGGLFFAGSNGDPERSGLRNAIELRGDAPTETASHLASLDELLAIEKEEREARAAYAAAMQPYIDAEIAGRQWVKRLRAERARSSGEPVDVEDFM